MARFLIASMQQQVRELRATLTDHGLLSSEAPEALAAGIGDLFSDLSHLDHTLEAYVSAKYLFESTEVMDKSYEAWRSVYCILDSLARAGWSCAEAQLQPHIIWYRVGLIKAKYNLDKLWILLGKEDFRNASNGEVDVGASVEKKYLDQLGQLDSKPTNLPEPVPTWNLQKMETTCETCDTMRNNVFAANTEIAKLKIEKAQRLKEEKNWLHAELVFNEVIELEKDWQGPKVLDWATIQQLRYEVAEMQMKQGKHLDAENTARQVWEERKRQPGKEGSDATRSVQWQLCRALRAQEDPPKLEEATRLYREVWEEKRMQATEDRNWRFKNGHELGVALFEQGRLGLSFLQHKEVWNERHTVADVDEIERVSSLEMMLDVLAVQEQLELDNPESLEAAIIMVHRKEILELIWGLFRGHRGAASPGITARGHELGSLLLKQQDLETAASILNEVWEVRKEHQDDILTLETGDLLAEAQTSRGQLDEAVRVYKWICHTREPLQAERPQLLDTRHKLGHLLFQKGLFDESAAEFREVWEAGRHDARIRPSIVPDSVFDAGLHLALSLERLPHHEEEAFGVIQLVCQCKSSQIHPLPLPVNFGEALARIQQVRPPIVVIHSPPVEDPDQQRSLKRSSRQSTSRDSKRSRERSITERRYPSRRRSGDLIRPTSRENDSSRERTPSRRRPFLDTPK